MDEKLTKDEIVEAVSKAKIDKAVKISKEDEKTANEVMEALGLPIRVKNKDIEFGAGELDITKLSNKNIMQMFFRTQIATNLYLNDISRAILDLTRLFMAYLYKEGVEDITSTIAETLEKLQKEAEKIKN
jgi:hypothetical protein